MNNNRTVFYALIAVAVLASTGCGMFKKSGALDADRKTAAELYGNGLDKYLVSYYEESEKSLKSVLEEYPLSSEAVEASLLLADLYYAKGEYEDAAVYYTNFYTLHPGHPRAEYALFQKGMSYFKRIGQADRDQTSTRKSLLAFEDFLRDYPASTYAAKAGEINTFLKKRLAENEFAVARFYFRTKNYKGALMRFSDILSLYPDSGLADSAMYFVGESYERLGEERLAKETFASLLKSYPDSPYAKEAKTRL